MKKWTPVLIIVLLVVPLLAACDLIASVEQTLAPASVTSEPTVAVPTLEPLATPDSTIPVTTTAEIDQLHIWLPPEIGARTEAGAAELTQQIRAFNSANPELDVILEQKPVEGQGGILNYLRAGRTVAPTVLPDVIAVPARMLSETGVREVVYPLEGLVEPGPFSELYPAPATTIGTEEHLYGLPFATLGLSHMVYDPRVITTTFSLDWTTFVSNTAYTLVLPADSREGALLGLQFYLAEGGRLTNDAGQPDLQVEPLARALEKIAFGKGSLLQSHQLKTLEEAWQYYQLGLSDTVWARSEFLLAQIAGAPTGPDGLRPNQAYSAVPGPGGPLTPLVTSWAWSIATPDPARQHLAAELITFLSDVDNLAAWSAASQVLPARRDAVNQLADSDEYYAFVDRQMQRAGQMPIRENSRQMDVLGQAVFRVLTTDTPPATIAEEAVASLSQ